MQNQIDTSTTGRALDLMDGLTSATLITIALFALIVIAGIVYGAKLKRGRTAARHEVEARNDTVIPDDAPLDDEAATDVPPADSATVASEQARSRVQPEAMPVPEFEAAPPPPLDSLLPPVAAPDPGAAPLTTLKGLGPKIAEALAGHGIARIDQLAGLDEARAAALDAQLGAFSGRLYRDKWIEQARLLTAGDRAGYEAAFGRL